MSTVSPGFADETLGRVDELVDRAAGHLFAHQRADGLWTDTLPSSAVATAPALIGLHYYDRPAHLPELLAGAAWLREVQFDDGSWGDTLVTPGNVHSTAFAMGALAIVDGPSSGEAIKRGMRFIEENGGLAAVMDRKLSPLSPISLVFWSLGGLCDEREAPRIPVELALCPQSLRHRMSFTVPGIFALGLMQARTQRRTRLRSLVDLAARRPALRYLENLQQFEGYDGGFEESPMLVGVVLLGLARAGLGGDMARRCHDYLLATRRSDGSWAVNRDLEFTSSCAVLMGLQESGLAHEDRLAPARHRVLSAQRTESFPPTGAPAGGWSWSLPSGWPDTDDTAGALTVLAGWGLTAADPRVRAGARWLLRMQRGNGSWGCFVTRGIVGLDAPCPMLTAHALEGLRAATRMSARHPVAQHAFGYLASAQRRDGSFPTLWYRNFTMGTAAVLTAYGVFGLAEAVPARLARRWLLEHQLADGSWNDGGPSEPSVEETSWALYALLAAGLPARSGPAAGASRWLAEHQLPDGGWPPTTLGVYFPNLYFSSDHLANGYALRALGNLRQRLREDLLR